MLMTMRFCIVIVLCMCYVYEVFAQQCKEDEHAISGMMLRGHTFRTMRSSIAFECHQACYNDFRCHSFNYVISEEVCELNNRTKEARPENFVPNFERYYVRSNKKRVPLGSVPEFPAETCKEIKASEEGKATSGSYWLDSIIKGKTLLVPCDMETADADECKASLPVCNTNAICQNTLDSYICACKPGVIADGRTCTAVPSCEALGVEDPNIVPDAQITASSNYLSYYPRKGRLNGDSGWCQQSSKITDNYIQVDMGAGRTVCGVATQGKANGSFIKSYRLSFSTDGTSWTAYKEQNVEKIFEANSDLNTIVKHTLNNPVQARYIRFYPVTFSGYPCMRIEVFVQ